MVQKGMLFGGFRWKTSEYCILRTEAEVALLLCEKVEFPPSTNLRNKKVSLQSSVTVFFSAAAEWRRSCLPLRLMNALNIHSVILYFCFLSYHSLWLKIHFDAVQTHILFLFPPQLTLWLKMHFASISCSFSYGHSTVCTYLYDSATFDSSFLSQTTVYWIKFHTALVLRRLSSHLMEKEIEKMQRLMRNSQMFITLTRPAYEEHNISS